MCRNKLLSVAVVLLISIFSFASCELLEEDDSVSVEERIEIFEDDVNSGVSINITPNFHSDMKSATQANWDGVFAYSPLDSTHIPVNFEVPESIEQNTPVPGEVTASGIMFDKESSRSDYIFTFKEETSGDGIWLIKTITLNNQDFLSGISLK
ncbi:MAG: hypothetical protein B6241_04040 [Spirochaetaceae bacterium 4572_59]|nr:MAG: hypothetical protein B6241_04040 [Spirochaetaceae bacterium 4572_59]